MPSGGAKRYAGQYIDSRLRGSLALPGVSRRTNIKTIVKSLAAGNLAVWQCLLKLFHTLVGDSSLLQHERFQVDQRLQVLQSGVAHDGILQPQLLQTGQPVGNSLVSISMGRCYASRLSPSEGCSRADSRSDIQTSLRRPENRGFPVQGAALLNRSFSDMSHARRVVETIGRSSAVSDCVTRRATRWRSAVVNSSVGRVLRHTLRIDLGLFCSDHPGCWRLVFATHDDYS